MDSKKVTFLDFVDHSGIIDKLHLVDGLTVLIGGLMVVLATKLAWTGWALPVLFLSPYLIFWGAMVLYFYVRWRHRGGAVT